MQIGRETVENVNVKNAPGNGGKKAENPEWCKAVETLSGAGAENATFNIRCTLDAHQQDKNERNKIKVSILH